MIDSKAGNIAFMKLPFWQVRTGQILAISDGST